MNVFKTLLAAFTLVGGIAMTTAESEAMPVQPLVATSHQADVQNVYWRRYPVYGWRRPFIRRYYGYGWRRPLIRRPIYAYGWRRPFIGRWGYRGYGYRGYGYRYGYNRRLIGSRAR